MTAGELLRKITELLRKGKRVVLHIYLGGGRINKVEHTKEGLPE